jgi:S-sulfo-L-cysteine synthase (3-phospho-L-serine-dependent)
MSKHIVFVEWSSTGAGERAFGYCAEQGYEISLLTAAPTSAPAGVRSLSCETADGQAVADAAERLHAEHPVDGITTTHDLYVPQAAAAAERLGLPGLGATVASGLRNKYRMRCALADRVPRLNPAFRLVTTVAEGLAAAEEIGYPLVGKPQDGFDSWQVIRIDGPDQLEDYLRDMLARTVNPAGLPMSEGVLLEGFVDGPEYSVETTHGIGGEATAMAITYKDVVGADDRHFTEIGLALPAPERPAELLLAAVREALVALGVRCGVIHTECRMVGDQVTIMEINPRLAGDMVGSHMIELACGADPIAQVVEIALGKEPQWRPTRHDGAAIYGFGVPETGEFESIDNLDELLTLPGVTAVRRMQEPGARCQWPPRSNLDLVARVLTAAPTAAEAMQLARQAAAKAKVTTRGPAEAPQKGAP